MMLLAIIVSSASILPAVQPSVTIDVASGTEREQRTKQTLQQLLATYDLRKYTFTRRVVIEEGAVNHAFPVLTLNARFASAPDELLTSYVHEQIHWHLVNLSKETDEAIKELRALFPKVPAGGPEGARDENSTYLHLLVCYLEYRADRELMGELRAKQVMEFWSTDHYTWVYRTVLERARDIGNIAFKYKLVPQQTSPPPK